MQFPIVGMRNEKTGESGHANLIGETKDGRPIYQRLKGWDLEPVQVLVGDNLEFPPFSYTFDVSGNYVLRTIAEAAADALIGG